MISQIAELKATNKRIKGGLLPLLQWDDETLFDFQFRTGREFLQSYLSQSPIFIDEMVNTRSFWIWFINLWNSRDEVFLANLTPGLKHSNYVRQYYAVHNPHELVTTVFLSNAAMQEAFDRLTKNKKS
jgi:hypothetical protein